MTSDADTPDEEQAPVAPVAPDTAPNVEPDEVKKDKPSNIVLLNGQVEIMTDKPLPHLDQGEVKAFAARIKGETAESFYALICERHLIPRSYEISMFKTIHNPSLVKVAGGGVAYWPDAGEERYILIYENNLGMQIVPSISDSRLELRQDVFHDAVVVPLINMLLDLRDSNLFHGNIRPTNIYDGGVRSENIERVIVGECLSTPAGYTQPVMFETLDRAMTDPIARGRGKIEHDLYALGVTLVHFMREKDPMAGYTDQEIIRAKIEQGSLAALVGKERMGGGILELVRGLLYDDTENRWTIDEVVNWLDGQRLSPKQNVRKFKSSRPIRFMDADYTRPINLARDMWVNRLEAKRLVETRTLDNWMERSLESNNIRQNYETAVNGYVEAGYDQHDWDGQLARIYIAMDEDIPIIYGDVIVNPDGFGYALARDFYLDKDLQPYVNIINQKLIMFWVDRKSAAAADSGAVIGRFENCLTFLRQKTRGYGIERILYYTCPEMPCASERFTGFYIDTPDALIDAFEKIVQRKDAPMLAIDHHVAAFLGVKDRKVIDNYLPEINSPDLYWRILGNVKTLAAIQHISRSGKYPNVAEWISTTLDPVYEMMHDRDLRDAIKKRIEQLKSGGDITKIAGLLSNKDIFKKDMGAYRRAMREYKDLREEKAMLTANLDKPAYYGRQSGREVSAMVSGVLSLIVIVSLAFLHIIRGSL